ncbi:hypothetical protein [Streptomyces sp. NBC_01518]|uniref:hypothetical protein n=1 Tax=Streptomyces sp. NBC_01518 TaxID=2903891 RepID=UPI003867946A
MGAADEARMSGRTARMTRKPGAGAITSASFLDRIRERVPQLRASEEKVATVVLGDPERVIRESVAALAQRAEVSEPTAMRFASGRGFDGYQDFKMQLAQSPARSSAPAPGPR